MYDKIEQYVNINKELNMIKGEMIWNISENLRS